MRSFFCAHVSTIKTGKISSDNPASSLFSQVCGDFDFSNTKLDDRGLIRVVLHMASVGMAENLNISNNPDPATVLFFCVGREVTACLSWFIQDVLKLCGYMSHHFVRCNPSSISSRLLCQQHLVLSVNWVHKHQVTSILRTTVRSLLPVTHCRIVGKSLPRAKPWKWKSSPFYPVNLTLFFLQLYKNS